MAQLTLKARPIRAKTKGEVKALRRNGSIPVTLQHRGDETLHLEASMVEMDKIMSIYGESAVFDLLIENEPLPSRAMIHEVQRNPVTRVIIQATLQKMKTDDVVKTHLMLVFRGEPNSVKLKTNVVLFAAETVEVLCAQDKLPDHITVDIEHLAPLGKVHVSDLPKMDGVQILLPPETVLISLGASAKSEPAPVVAAA